MGGNELNYVHEAFDTNWIAPLGPNVAGFERSLESFIGQNVHVAGLSSGTAAIHLSLDLLDVGPGDLVICQSFTFSASANPILYRGASPVFVDSERDTWNISPELLEQAILDCIAKGKKPKAIVAVHLYGVPYKVDEIKAISEAYNIPVIEDSAEALGSMYKGIPCGSLGTIGILSFNGNKIITTSGGGALVTKSKDLKERAIYLATQARDAAPHYQHSVVGYNYRLSNVLAGIGRGQMEVLEDRVAKRRSNFEFYKKELAGYAQLEFLEEPQHCFSNRWLSTVLTPSYEVREKLRLALEDENIESRPLWKPLHLQPVFENTLKYTDGTSEELFKCGLCLPSGSNLSEEDLWRTTRIIKENLS
ncbi:DegT/DnrJ/EryC1/StrS family aminotransferase [Robiginitalea sp. IMCC43444]|uniref:DegT/DnrJ/EryC1/StrS family aminotransferase n=1 Tax=Robiginitalea sp. IMCC43444 TaxID=3459121 RepID=UPI0040426320